MGPPSTITRRSPDLFLFDFWGGGTYAKPLRTMLKRGITYTGRVDLGFSLVDVDLEGKARQPPW